MFKIMLMCRLIKKEKINEEICVCIDREYKFFIRNYYIKLC